MYCRYCGVELPDDSIYCNKCGKAQGTDSTLTDETVDSVQVEGIENYENSVNGGVRDKGKLKNAIIITSVVVLLIASIVFALASTGVFVGMGNKVLSLRPGMTIDKVEKILGVKLTETEGLFDKVYSADIRDFYGHSAKFSVSCFYGGANEISTVWVAVYVDDDTIQETYDVLYSKLVKEFGQPTTRPTGSLYATRWEEEEADGYKFDVELDDITFGDIKNLYISIDGD